MTCSALRKYALAIFRAALAASDPQAAVRRHLRREGGVLIAGRQRYRLDRFRSIQVLGAGKASGAMARAVEGILGARVAGGFVNVKDGHLAPVKRVTLHECGHPVPDARGVEGARRIAELASSATADDLIIGVISGGASALMPLPASPITLGEKQETTRLLLASGATIHEINTLRKHISAIKGGHLARLAHPATLIALVLSDVIGDDLDVIGSGPTVPDRSDFAAALSILARYRLLERVPAAVRGRLEAGAAGEIAETPKPGAPEFKRTQNLVVGSNALAVDAAAARARELGLRPLVLSTFVEGETREVAQVHAAIAKEILRSNRPVRTPACVISGGETTVTLRGQGLGGRNQEFTLAAALAIAGQPEIVVLSGGTDGTDGPTDAAGAIADHRTVAAAGARGLEARRFLDDNDSYRFFDSLGDLIRTGPTNTNVMDIRLVLVDRPRPAA